MHGCCRTRPNWHIGKPIINNCIGLLIWSNKRSLTNNHHACNTANVCLETNVPILNMHEVHYMQCISYCKSLRKALYRESFTAPPQVGAAFPDCFLEEGGIQVGLHHLGWEEGILGEGLRSGRILCRCGLGAVVWVSCIWRWVRWLCVGTWHIGGRDIGVGGWDTVHTLYNNHTSTNTSRSGVHLSCFNMVLVLCKCGGLCGSSGSACSYVWWLNKQAKYTRRYSARALNKEPYNLA